MFFWNKFCGLFILFFLLINFSYAQPEKQAAAIFPNISLQNEIVFLKKIPPPVVNISFSEVVKNKFTYSRNWPVHSLKNSHTAFSSVVPDDLATCKYGFFCRQELKIEKATKLPIRIRIGSLAQCNYYEGKQ